MRAKGIHIGYARSSVGLDLTAEKVKDRELAEYAAARRQGVQPAGTRTAQTRYAMERSEQLGRAWQADQPHTGEHDAAA